MKTKNSTFGVLFYLKVQKVTAKGYAPICARVTVNGKRTEISAKRSVLVSQWDAKKGLAKGSRKETVELNMFLDQFKARIIGVYQNMLLSEVVIDGVAIRDKVLGAGQSGPTLVSLMEYHNQEQGIKLAHGTMKNYYTTQSYLRKFLQNRYRRTDIPLSELNYKFLADFENYLRSYIPTDHQKQIHNNGIMKHIERLRKMVNMAIVLDWLPKDPFANFKKHFDKVERQCLNIAELNELAKKEFRIERLQHVRDMFLFSCYTGLSYIDLAELTPDNIIIGGGGKKAEAGQPAAKAENIEVASYEEVHDMDSSGTPINAHPLTVREANVLAKALRIAKEEKEPCLKSDGIMGNHILHIDPINGKAVWFTKAMQRELYFTEGLGIPKGKAHVPAMLWIAGRNSLSVFALASNRRPNLTTKLYNAPFFNVYEDSRVCMGTVDVRIKKTALTISISY